VLSTLTDTKSFSALTREDRTFSGFKTGVIAVNPVLPGRLLIGVYELYESTDFARTAARVELPNKPGKRSLTAAAAGSRETNGAAAPLAAYVAAGSGIWYRTSTGGPFAGPITPPGAGTITDITIDPENWRIAYALDAKHLYATIDGGLNWIDITGAAGRSG